MPKTCTPLPQLIYPRLKKLQSRIESLVYYDTQKLNVQIGPTHAQHVDVKTARAETYEPIQPGDTFSPRTAGEHGEFPWDSNRWFRIDIPPLSNEDETGRR